MKNIKEAQGSADSVYEAFSFPDGRATSNFGEPPLTFNGNPVASRAVEAAKEIFSAGVSAKKIAVLGQRVAGLVVAGAVVSAKDAKTVAGILEATAEYDFGEHFHPHRAATYLSSKQGDLMDEKSRRGIISILAGMFSPRRAEELIALAVSSLSKEGSPSAEILSVATERIGSLLTPRKTAELMVVAKNPASVEKNLRRSKDAGLLALHFFLRGTSKSEETPAGTDVLDTYGKSAKYLSSPARKVGKYAAGTRFGTNMAEFVLESLRSGYSRRGSDAGKYAGTAYAGLREYMDSSDGVLESAGTYQTLSACLDELLNILLEENRLEEARHVCAARAPKFDYENVFSDARSNFLKKMFSKVEPSKVENSGSTARALRKIYAEEPEKLEPEELTSVLAAASYGTKLDAVGTIACIFVSDPSALDKIRVLRQGPGETDARLIFAEKEFLEVLRSGGYDAKKTALPSNSAAERFFSEEFLRETARIRALDERDAKTEIWI